MASKNISTNTIAASVKIPQTPPTPNSRRSRQKALLHFLLSQFPVTFFEKEKHPLKVGIAEDILNWFEANPNDQIVVDAILLNSALAAYTANPQYMLCLQPEATRLDLTGQPVGKVTTEEAEQAKNRLEMLHHIQFAKHLKKRAAQTKIIKKAYALGQRAEKVIKKKQAPQLNPSLNLSHNSSLQTSTQSSSEKPRPIIRFIRKKFNDPGERK